MLVLRECLYRTLKERAGDFAVFLAAVKEAGVVYPDSKILAKFFGHYFEEVVRFLESWS